MASMRARPGSSRRRPYDAFLRWTECLFSRTVLAGLTLKTRAEYGKSGLVKMPRGGERTGKIKRRVGFKGYPDAGCCRL